MPEVRTLSYIQAVQHALRWALESREDTIIFGEDVAVPGGPFGATKNLHRDFGSTRIFDTPISESGFLGLALGAAMTGLRPIAEIMYADFLFVAMDPLVNQIANTRYNSEGRFQAPLVIRLQQGHSPGSCAQHSHTIETFVAHTPGLRLAVPSCPEDAYQLLRAAIVSDDPVVVAEARMLYPTKGPVDLGAPVQEIGKGVVRRSGSQATIVAWSTLVSKAIEAAETLAGEGIDVEVVDPRWLAPLDFDLIANSVAKTGRLVIAHEAPTTLGYGAEIAARVAAECFSDLKAPIQRVGALNVPGPSAPPAPGGGVPHR